MYNEINSTYRHTQIVLAGRKPKLAEVSQQLKREKLILKSTELAVSAPFHSSWMMQASELMKPKLERLESLAPSPTSARVLSNVTADMHSQMISDIQARLLMQIVAPVRWTHSIDCLRDEHGVRDWLCIGPGKTLAQLLQRDFPDDCVQVVDEFEDLARLDFGP